MCVCACVCLTFNNTFLKQLIKYCVDIIIIIVLNCNESVIMIVSTTTSSSSSIILNPSNVFHTLFSICFSIILLP